MPSVGVGLSKEASDDCAAHRSQEGSKQGTQHQSLGQEREHQKCGGCLGMKSKERHLPPLQHHELRERRAQPCPFLVAWAERGLPASYPSHQISDSKNCFVFSTLLLTAPILDMLGNGKQAI